MKLAMVILGGAADRPSEALYGRDSGGRTPLATARTPSLDALAAEGRVGAVHTIPKKLAPSVEVALASLLGRDPAEHPPAAGALLASALGVRLGPRDRAFRFDLVNVFDGAVADPTAGRLGEREAEILLGALREAVGSEVVHLVPGDRWRNLLVVGEGQADGVRTTPPRPGLVLEEHLPTGPGCELVKGLEGRCAAILEEHEINLVRIDLGENPANAVRIWGGGRPEEPSSRLAGVAVGHHPTFVGLAQEAGLDVVPTCVADEDGLPEVGRAALGAVEEAEFVVVFLDGALVSSRLGDFGAKTDSLAAADREVIGPLRERLVATGDGRVLVAASHAISCDERRELADPVPFVLAGHEVARFGEVAFTEEAIAEAELTVEHGHELLEFARRE